MESIEILILKIHEEINKLSKSYEEAKADDEHDMMIACLKAIASLDRVIDTFIPESIKEAAAELLSKCKFSKDIKDAPVHGDKYLIYEKTNAGKT